MREMLRAGGTGALLVIIMLGGGVLLWIGVPLAWLYIGSQVQSSTDSLGTALAVMMFGVIVSIAVIVAALGWLSRKHAELRAARGLEDQGQTALEATMTVSAGVAILGFGFWFFFLSGTSPAPVSLGI